MLEMFGKKKVIIEENRDERKQKVMYVHVCVCVYECACVRVCDV